MWVTLRVWCAVFLDNFVYSEFFVDKADLCSKLCTVLYRQFFSDVLTIYDRLRNAARWADFT